MADNTKIEWADATLNYVNGCTRVSPGCGQGGQGGCYAERLAGTRLQHHPSRAGLTKPTPAGPRWTGEVRAHEPALMQALKWKRGRRIFWNAHGDLFHEAVPDEWIDRLFAVCALTPQHTHMILTKRSARMREWFARRQRRDAMPAHEILAAMDGISREKWPELSWPLPNVWLGVSVEDQACADERVPDLLAAPAAIRFISAEPLLGPVDLRAHGLDVHHHPDNQASEALTRAARKQLAPNGAIIDWVIAGGESGPGARPMHPDWARSLRDQCQAAGVAFHFKQWGEWLTDSQRNHIDLTAWNLRTFETRTLDEGTSGPFYRVGKKAAGRLLDGVEHNEFPK